MTSDDWVIFDLPTYPNQMIYYISLFSKIRYTLTYLPTPKSDVICGCSLKENNLKPCQLMKGSMITVTLFYMLSEKYFRKQEITRKRIEIFAFSLISL